LTCYGTVTVPIPFPALVSALYLDHKK